MLLSLLTGILALFFFICGFYAIFKAGADDLPGRQRETAFVVALIYFAVSLSMAYGMRFM